MFRFIILAVLLVSVTSGAYLASAQQSDDEVRGAFVSSRPKSTNANAPARRRRRPPRNTNTSATTLKNTNTEKNTNVAANASFANVNSNRRPMASIALGYTIFMRDMNGRAVRVDPAREFRNGDRIRISLETNTDGYLYVFHTENDGPPQLLFPDSRLEGGENWIEAHVPVDIPSDLETDERLRWFQFYGNAGVERLYVVVTREPLPEVPVGEALMNFCTANKDKCPWRPPVQAWLQVQQAAKAEVRIVTSKQTVGQVQTEKEQVATTRGLGLDQTAPQPSVIRMSASTNLPVLVTILDLMHK